MAFEAGTGTEPDNEPVPGALDLFLALSARALIFSDLSLDIGKTGSHACVGVEVEELEQAEAAGTR